MEKGLAYMFLVFLYVFVACVVFESKDATTKLIVEASACGIMGIIFMLGSIASKLDKRSSDDDDKQA